LGVALAGNGIQARPPGRPKPTTFATSGRLLLLGLLNIKECPLPPAPSKQEGS